VVAIYGSVDADCRPTFSPDPNVVEGPVFEVQPHDTVAISFPQPFVIGPQPGSAACLRIGKVSQDFSIGVITIVGYRIEP
jgi:hypothetical protein